MELVMSNQWTAENENKICSKFPIHRACRDNDVKYIKYLVNDQKEVYNQEIYSEDVYYNWTPFHWAAYFGKDECMDLLLKTSPLGSTYLLNLQCSTNKQTALHLVAFIEASRAVEWMVRNGADPNIKDYLQETPLHKAARSGEAHSAEILIKFGAKANVRNIHNLTPAIVARDSGNRDLALELEKIEKKECTMVGNGIISSNCYHGFHLGVTGAKTVPMDVQTTPSLGRDITLSKDFLLDRIPVAGRKRRREEDDAPKHKRTRFNDDTSIIPPTMFMTDQELAIFNETSDGGTNVPKTTSGSGQSSLPLPIYHSEFANPMTSCCKSPSLTKSLTDSIIDEHFSIMQMERGYGEATFFHVHKQDQKTL